MYLAVTIDGLKALLHFYRNFLVARDTQRESSSPTYLLVSRNSIFFYL